MKYRKATDKKGPQPHQTPKRAVTAASHAGQSYALRDGEKGTERMTKKQRAQIRAERRDNNRCLDCGSPELANKAI